MLSRAAERVYWAGRYLERAENTARIIQQYSQLHLDLPHELDVSWDELFIVLGADDAAVIPGSAADEKIVFDYLLADPRNPNSLTYAIKSARDNIRNARDLLPQESWESANELHQYARQNLEILTPGQNYFEVLAECIGRCQLINGILSGTMSHNSPYHFLRLGQSIERVDMTSRIIDMATTYLQRNVDLMHRYGSTLWTNLLKSVSAFQMYRQYVQPQVQGVLVIDFLLRDRAFPRAIRACIDATRSSAAELPRSQVLIAALTRVDEMLQSPVIAGVDTETVTALMDDLQQSMGLCHQIVVDTWFPSYE